MSEEISRIHQKIDEQSGDIKQLTAEIANLAKAIAEKEVKDHHLQKEIDDIKTRQNNHSDRIRLLENVQSGQQAERKLWDMVIKPAITVVVAAIIGGALYAFVMKG